MRVPPRVEMRPPLSHGCSVEILVPCRAPSIGARDEGGDEAAAREGRGRRSEMEAASNRPFTGPTVHLRYGHLRLHHGHTTDWVYSSGKRRS